MTAPLDWRRIERALVEWFRLEWEVGDVPITGDKIAELYDDADDRITGNINLTALAKHLSDELTSP